MKRKVLNVVHKDFKSSDKKEKEEQIEFLVDYFGDKKPDWTPEIEFEFTDIEVDFDIEYAKIGTTNTGKVVYGADNVKRYIYPITSEGEYDLVVFWYEANFSDAVKYGAKFGKTIFAHFCYRKPLYDGTPMISMQDSLGRESTLAHEFSHAYKYYLNPVLTVDYMDKTPIKVNGKIVWEKYYKNNAPYADDGNFAKTWKLYKNYSISEKTEDVEEDLAPVIDNTVATVSIGYTPKYFTLKELVPANIYTKYGDTAWQFLDRRVIMNLDYIREKLGKPILVNYGTLNYRGYDDGGYRTSNSQHKHGRAIDFDVIGMSAQQVRDWIVKNYKLLPEPNVWLEDGVSWCHMDVRYSDKDGVYLFKP